MNNHKRTHRYLPLLASAILLISLVCVQVLLGLAPFASRTQQSAWADEPVGQELVLDAPAQDGAAELDEQAAEVPASEQNQAAASEATDTPPGFAS